MKSNYFPERIGKLDYSLCPEKVTKFLLVAIALLILGNIAEREIIQWLNSINETQVSFNYFNFDTEANFPSIYSALTLAFCSYLLTIITKVKQARQSKDSQYWKSLSFIFIYLAIDEICSIHELLIPILQNTINAGGIFYFAWVIPGFFLLLAFLLIFRKFILNLPSKTRRIFILAGTIYISGALGMELVGGYIADTIGFDTFAYGMVSRTEELLEMFGILIFIRGLLFYIQTQITELKFSISFEAKT